MKANKRLDFAEILTRQTIMFKKKGTHKLKFIGLSLIILAFSVAGNAQSGRKSTPPASDAPKQAEEKKGADRPVKITRRPEPEVDVIGQCFREEGLEYVETVLRITFDASGDITIVEILNSSGCRRFDLETVRVASLIEFKPAVKDGKPQTVTKRASYAGGIRRNR